jgi:hypothetical protein
MPSTSTSMLDGLSTSVAVKAPCATVAQTPITLSGLQTINGVAVVEGDRVLVIAQTDGTENGIYSASTGAWTRALDFDGNRDVVRGTRVTVRSDGIDGAEYELVTADPVVIGTSTITFILVHGDDLRIPQTAVEIAAGIIPADYSYQPGDPRRYHSITVTDEEIKGLYCHGYVPTYGDSDTFTVVGDATDVYPDRTRLAVFSASERKFGQVLSTSYSDPNTTVEMRMEIGNLPASPLAVLKYVSPQMDRTNTFMVDFNAPQVMQVINQNDGASAATQLFVGDFDASGIGITATKSTTVGSFPGGVYYSLAPNNPISAIATGLAIPICIVTHDRTRMVVDGDGLPTQFSTSLIVQQTNENPNGSTTSKVTIDGTATAYLSLKVNSVEQALFSTTTSAATFGTITNIPVDFYSNSIKRLSLDTAGNVVLGAAAGAISTSATDGFTYVPSCAGTPTGTPTSKSGMIPIVIDSTNHRFYFFSGGSWRNAGP